jgi:AbrB family looped-hinge helix DNA binding protein
VAGRLRNAPRILRAAVDAKGRVTLPKPLRTQLGLTPGTTLVFRVEGEALHATTPNALLRRMRAARLALQRRLKE